MPNLHWHKYVRDGLCSGFVVQLKEAVTCNICLALLANEPPMVCKCATQNDAPGYQHQDGCPLGRPFLAVKDVKMTREALCAAQHALTQTPWFNSAMLGHWVRDIQRLIDECDRHRPLGVDGKHSNLHTDTCGCEDKGPRETWGTATRIVHARVGADSFVAETWCGLKGAFYVISLAEKYEDITCRSCISEIERNI